MKRSFKCAFGGVVEYTCPMSDDPLHRSLFGCCLIDDDVHIYKRLIASRNIDNDLITDLFNFGVDYSNETLKNGNVIWKTPLPRSFKKWNDVIDTPELFRDYFGRVLKEYREKIQPILEDEYIDPICLFDNVFDGDQFIHLRPITLARDFDSFICGVRRIFFTMFKQIKFADVENVAFKDRLVCNSKSFIGQRAPPELNCESPDEGSCPHIIAALDNTGTLDIEKVPQRFCKFLLKKIIETESLDFANSRFGFKCQFIDSEIKYMLQIFKRTNFHRLCIPDQFLNKDWFEWFYQLLNESVIL